VAQADLPGAIRDFAERNGAAPGSDARAARLTQDAEYRRGPDAEWGPMPAVQHMGLGRAAFVWNARAPGPLLPSFTVIDGYVGGTGMLRAMLFGPSRSPRPRGRSSTGPKRCAGASRWRPRLCHDGFYWGYWRGRITSVEILR
jgi:hypothetical protein